MRKSNIIFLCALFTFLVSNCIAQGQHNFIGIKGGIAIPNLTSHDAGDNPFSAGYSSMLGSDVAVFWEHAITGKFSILSSIEHASQGVKKDGFQPFTIPSEYSRLFPPGQAPAFLYADFKNTLLLDYVMLNALAKFNWHLGEASHFILYAEGGPFGAYLVLFQG